MLPITQFWIILYMYKMSKNFQKLAFFNEHVLILEIVYFVSGLPFSWLKFNYDSERSFFQWPPGWFTGMKKWLQYSIIKHPTEYKALDDRMGGCCKRGRRREGDNFIDEFSKYIRNWNPCWSTIAKPNNNLLWTNTCSGN